MSSNGNVIEDTDVIANASVGYVPAEEVCEKTCNGKSYAYRLKILQSYTTQVSGQVTPNNKNMYLTGQPKYENLTLALQVPYWQPISIGVWNNMSPLHPYKSNLGYEGSGSYLKLPIANSGLIGPFYDKSNTPIGTDGWLVEKKLDQFSHFNNRATPITYLLSPTICTNTLNGMGSSWINSYNLGVDNVNYPTITNPFTLTVSHDLECLAATGNPSPGDTNNYGGAWGTWLSEMYKELFKIEDLLDSNGWNHDWDSFNNALEELGEYDGGDGGNVAALTVRSISSGNSTNIEYTKNVLGEPLRLREATGNLNPGLYSMYVFTDANEILPFFFEVHQDVPMPKDKEFVNFTIAPNPLINKFLNATIDSEKSMAVNLFVHNLNGDLLYNSTLNIIDGVSYQIQHDFSQALIPYDQVILTLSFEDGSVLQKFASTLN